MFIEKSPKFTTASHLVKKFDATINRFLPINNAGLET